MGWTRSGLSGAAAVSLLLLGAVGPWAGRLADRWGARRLIMWSLLLLGFGTILMGQSTKPSASTKPPVSTKPPSSSTGKPQKQKVTQVQTPRVHERSDTVGVVNDVVITYGDFNSIMSGYLKAWRPAELFR